MGGGGSTGGGGGVSTFNNRPSHHKYKYKSPKQFELKQTDRTNIIATNFV